ncbi:MAG: L-threonylcarbamoyladenylate synthase [Candidatus Poribacteria bacterium]|nr:L-threonylcarbamoyladenylate synthase [Candidatus Poribacteria bacterium]MDP6994564.1 L-threonylcarbamoyladenylate synthase [Candidatus Poribacteria bacterium]
MNLISMLRPIPKLDDSAAPVSDLLITAAQLLQLGQVVAFPTDTVYGVGADPFNPDAIQQLFDLKGRPDNKPIPLLVSAVDQVEQVAEDIPPLFFELAEQHWPGALTLVLEAKDHLPTAVTAGRSTVGVRMPAHDLACQLIHTFGGPIATTSANRSDYPPATTVSGVVDQLGSDILVLDGGLTKIQLSSTVLDLTTDPPLFLRKGSVTLS